MLKFFGKIMKHTLVETFLVVETFHCVKSVFSRIRTEYLSVYISTSYLSVFTPTREK